MFSCISKYDSQVLKKINKTHWGVSGNGFKLPLCCGFIRHGGDFIA